MKISELIEVLKAYMDKRGDVPVMLDYTPIGDYPLECREVYNCTWNGKVEHLNLVINEDDE